MPAHEEAPLSHTADDRRGRARRDAYSAGLVVSRDGVLKLDCRVEDVTAAGAKLTLTSEIPEELYLLVSGKEVAYEAHAVWHRDKQHGVKFTNTLPIHGLKDTKLNFLRNLKLERLRG
jgi:hypothetical protein